MTSQALSNNSDCIQDSEFHLIINEIFFSIQGESTTIGLPTIFIRLTGCPLRCQYCDTEYAFHSGKKQSSTEILNNIKHYSTPYVTVTGGEPLAQKNCLSLLTLLLDNNYKVSLETSGAIDISNVDIRTKIIMDIKTPASKEVDKNLYTNFDSLKPSDEIKFVICDRNDYKWSKELIKQYNLINKHTLLFSNSHTELSATELANWIIQDQLPVRMQTQLHKYLWGDVPGK